MTNSSDCRTLRLAVYSIFTHVGVLLTTAVLLVSQNAGAARSPSGVEPRANSEVNEKAQLLADDGKIDEAVKLLSDVIKNETDKERRALARLSLAMINYRANRDKEAEANFKLAIDEGTRVADYAHYYLGLVKRRTGRDTEAQVDFSRVIELKSPKTLEVEARLQLSEILMATKQWRVALASLDSLRKAYRGKDKYPEILFNVVRANMHAGRKPAACKPARELYSKYPSLPALREWGPSLAENKVDGIRLGCLADNRDLKTRVRRLWLGGEADRATAELRSFKVEGTVEDDEGNIEPARYGLDAMLANHLLGEGQTADAMKLILKHYGSQKNRPNYQALLAKASARAGEYQSAIASFQKAYDLAPRAKNAANYLFQAAFTSYQIQDYDGATRRFERLVKAFPSGRMTSDARWHLAWMRYLRTDYKGAFESFAALAHEPRRTRRIRRGRRVMIVRSEPVATDRIQYWSAMSLLRQGKTQEATALFERLVQDPSVSFYALVSYYRLLGLPGAKVPAAFETRIGLAKRADGAQPSEQELKEAATNAIASAQDEIAADNPSNEGIANEAATGAVAETEEADEPDEDAAEIADNVPSSNFKDPELSVKFERARDLAFAGIEDGARRELLEIEKRARSVSDRRLLMFEYAQVRNFERSSYIGELGFGAARLREGLRGDSRQYWEFAYPRAWEPAVVKASKSTSVPEELIWGIMRAESHYRQDAQSPVGALGLMQIMPFTGRKVASLLNIGSFETRSLLEPETNIRLGARYLQRLLEKFEGNVALTAASYNAGPHRVHAWVRNFGTLEMDEFIEHIPYVETRNYVKRVTRNFQIYGFLYRNNAKTVAKNSRWLVQPVGVDLKDSVTAGEIW